MAVAIAVWFYRTAIQIHDPKPFVWVFNSVAAYYLVVFLWWFLVLRQVSASFHHKGEFSTLILLTELAGYALALLVVWLIRKRWVASAAGRVS
ncbi:MAG: hypothetical protein N3A55_06490 [Methylohalobius sp.]|nr:hypothetical protein [Methylohalobius sp.]